MYGVSAATAEGYSQLTFAKCYLPAGTLEFRSNKERHRPVIRALELLKKYAVSKVRTFPPEGTTEAFTNSADTPPIKGLQTCLTILQITLSS